MIDPVMIDPAGLTAVAAAVVLWPVAGRLGLRPASRAAATALFAWAALLLQLSAVAGVDGWAALLFAVAAWSVVGGPVRNSIALMACVAAVALAPITAIGVAVLGGALLIGGRVATRWSPRSRRVWGCTGMSTAAAAAVAVAHPGVPPALPSVVLGVVTAWALVVAGLVWTRLRWLRPVAAAALALAGSAWLPGADAAAVTVVAAVVTVLTLVLAEEAPALVTRSALATGVLGLAAVLAADTTAPPAAGPATPVAVVAVRPDYPVSGVKVETAQVWPVSIAIPALDVAGPLAQLSVDTASGELGAPDDPALAGWYAAGTLPGDVGPAVIGGHVDSAHGPGVFSRLATVAPGDHVDIVRSDRRTVGYTVTAVTVAAKDDFPTRDVYGPTPGPELRLVTCGGTFDREARSYRDNVIVRAVLR